MLGLLLLAAAAGAASVGAEEPRPAPAPTRGTSKPSRLVLLLNAGVVPTKLDLSEARSFTEFAEEGSLDVSYTYDTGYEGEAGLRYFFIEHFGTEALFSFLTRNGSAEFSGRFPHPLYLNRPREASGTVEDLSYEEKTVHVNLVFAGGKGSFGFALFGGASFFLTIEPGLIGQPQYSQSFPFDDLTITGVPVLSPAKDAVGFNAGGELEYRFSHRVGAAITARYSRATVRLDVDQANSIEFVAGGLFVGLGFRVRF